MSYLEIYNENIRDLLNPGSGHLELRDDSKGRNIQGPILQNSISAENMSDKFSKCGQISTLY
jgi:kinesin family protein 18/19